MLVSLHVSFADGRHVEIAREVSEEEAELSPREHLQRYAAEGMVAISDSQSVPIDSVADVRFAYTEAERGPGWGPGLQDEDASAAARANYTPRGR